jgi:sugar phosphate isomerase/epimerase
MTKRLLLSRRDFLQTTALTLAAGLASNETCSAAIQPKASKAWLVTCRDVGLKDVPGKADCWAAARELAIDGISVVVNDDLSCPFLFHPTKHYSVATDAGIRMLQDDLAANHLVVTTFASHYFESEHRIYKDMELARRLIPVAQKMNVKAIRVGLQARKMATEEFLPRAVAACKTFCDAAAGTSFVLATENHGKPSNDPAFLGALLDGVGSTNIGVTLDPNNFYWYGWPLQQVYGYYERFAPRAVHAHCKNVRYPADQRNVRRQPDKNYRDHAASLYDGDIDYRRVAAILRKANYQNDLCLENECLQNYPQSQWLTVLRKELALLRTLAQTA